MHVFSPTPGEVDAVEDEGSANEQRVARDFGEEEPGK